MDLVSLLERCSANLKSRRVVAMDETLLRRWNAGLEHETDAFTACLTATATTAWDGVVTEHEAHRHYWYDFVQDEITIDEMAIFLLENGHYPAFLTLLERIREAQSLDEARAAIDENIADEHSPEPHAELMRRLMTAVKRRARPDLILEQHPTLVDRTLVFYYGYFCDPWHLVGSVFATERLGTRRVICMGEGFKRLGLSEHEPMFTTIHADCDDHHAGDWLERVILPGIAFDDSVRPRVAAGIAACLETSHAYLDFLSNRAINGRLAAAGSLPGPDTANAG
jgi:Iron-containing redox enzyme